MNDKETMGAMLARAGIATDSVDPGWIGPVDNEIMVEARGLNDPRQPGYGAFFAVFRFDEAGALVQIGIWE